MDENTINEQARNLTKAIFQHESGMNFDIKGDNGTSTGAGQWQSNTWKAHAKDVLGDEKAQMTKENQSVVAQGMMRKWIKEGKNAAQIAAIWNSGSDKNWENKVGTKTYPDGTKIDYNVPKYVKSVTDLYQSYKGVNSQPGALQTQQDVTSGRKTFTELLKGTQDTTSSEPDKNLKTYSMGKGALGKPLALEQGLGYVASNLMGGQKGLIEAQDRALQTQNQLVGLIKKNKAQGKDTSRLENSLKQVNDELKVSAENITNAGTGGITNKQLGVSTLEHAVAVPAIIGGAGVLASSIPISILKDPDVVSSIQRVIPKSELVKNLKPGELLNATTEAIAQADKVKNTALKLKLTELAKTLGPKVLQEAKIGTWSSLNPKSAKALGLAWSTVKFLGRIGGDIAGIKGINMLGK